MTRLKEDTPSHSSPSPFSGSVMSMMDDGALITMDELDYNALYSQVFKEDYPGYKPNVIESPNGDGKLDADKRYAHIAIKYLNAYEDKAAASQLFEYLVRCHTMASRVAYELDMPPEFMPDISASALRVLDYPAGAITHPHTDFNLFTLMMYRDKPDYFKYAKGEPSSEAQSLNHQIHMGELYELIGKGDATEHEVVASDERQRSIVYFALPRHKAILPNGMSVGDWLQERMSRSRHPAPGKR